MYRFEKFKVWQKSMGLCLAVYEETRKFPSQATMTKLENMVGDVGRLLQGLINSLSPKSNNQKLTTKNRH